MESIDQRLARIDQRLTHMEKMLSLLVRAKSKEAKSEEWLTEKEAANMLGWKPRTLRTKAKSGIIPIQFQSRQGRNFIYNKDQVLKFKIYPIIH